MQRKEHLLCDPVWTSVSLPRWKSALGHLARVRLHVCVCARLCAPCECRCALQGRQGAWAWGWSCSPVVEQCLSSLALRPQPQGLPSQSSKLLGLGLGWGRMQWADPGVPGLWPPHVV